MFAGIYVEASLIVLVGWHRKFLVEDRVQLSEAHAYLGWPHTILAHNPMCQRPESYS